MFYLTINIFHLCFSLGEVSGFIFIACNYLLWNYQFSDTIPKIINLKLCSTSPLPSLFFFSSTWFLSLPLLFCFKTVAWDDGGTTYCHLCRFSFFLEFSPTDSLIIQDIFSILHYYLNFSYFFFLIRFQCL